MRRQGPLAPAPPEGQGLVSHAVHGMHACLLCLALSVPGAQCGDACLLARVRARARAQVGKFYEAAGYDALALCQFNDNRLTNHESPDSVRFPRAGSPVASVCKVLENLVVVNGLRVVRERQGRSMRGGP